MYEFIVKGEIVRVINLVSFDYLPQKNEACSEAPVIQAYTRSQMHCGTKTIIFLATNLPEYVGVVEHLGRSELNTFVAEG